MFLKLYWLGAALALIQFLIQLQGVHHWMFVPDISEGFINTTFPSDLNTGTTSDVVLVKYPYRKYKHINQDGAFYLEDKLDEKRIEEIIYQSRALIWTISMRNSFNQVQHNCRKLHSLFVDSNDTYKYWIYNVHWNDSVIDQIPTDLMHMSTALPSPSTSCDMEPANIIIISREKEKSIAEKISGTKIKSPYVNQMAYFF
uniref:Secreted protein n=1 Tax=Strongyloides venezuelensis TaxID=75913 RepID=A0A0K0G0P7_STRVS